MVLALIAIVGGLNGGFALYKNVKEKKKSNPVLLKITELSERLDKISEQITPNNDERWAARDVEAQLMKNIIINLARDRITQSYKHFGDKPIEYSDIEHIQPLYDAYVALGQNGIIKQYWETLVQHCIHYKPSEK
jgi:hypothetical protein